MAPRAWRILWGPFSRFFTGSATVLTLIGFLERPLLGSISDTWQVMPWWVGLVALIPLLFYAFVRASYEEYRAVVAPPAARPTATQSDRDRKLEQLERRALRAEQERDKLRSFLADPTAKRRREEAMLRERCIDLAGEVRNFVRGYGGMYDNEPETVQRFKRRHYDKVTELRDELDRRGWLTTEEREALTLSPYGGTYEIKSMAELLGSIGVGR